MPTSVEKTRAGNSTRANGASGFIPHGKKSGHSTRRANPSWLEGWDVEAMRFGIHKSASDEDDGGEKWQVLDFYAPRFVAVTASKADAQLVADALEYLSVHVDADEFEAAL